jgi:tetratricopeptide (TPR) repeat protein
MTASRPPLSGSYEDLLARAQHALSHGDLQNALALYRRLSDRLAGLSPALLARRPDLAEMHRQARLELVGLLRLEGHYAEAIEAEAVLLDSHPDQADLWRTDMASLRVAKGEVQAGLDELRALAEDHPDDAWRWIILAREAAVEGRLVEAQEALDRARPVADEQDPQLLAELYYQTFRLYKQMGRLDDALAAWEESLRHDARVGQSVREVYELLTDAGRFSEARHYVDRDENELQAGYQRGILAQRRGDAAGARQAWQAVAGLDPSTFEYGHDAWVESVLRLGDPLPALEWLQEALGRVGTLRLLILSGIAWAMHRDGEMAGLLFQQAIKMQRRMRPPRQKLDSVEWRLLDSLVTDDEIKAPLKPYFAVVETLWG